MATKDDSIISRTPEMDPHHGMQFSLIPKTHLWGDFNPLGCINLAYSKLYQQGYLSIYLSLSLSIYIYIYISLRKKHKPLTSGL